MHLHVWNSSVSLLIFLNSCCWPFYKKIFLWKKDKSLRRPATRGVQRATYLKWFWRCWSKPKQTKLAGDEIWARLLLQHLASFYSIGFSLICPLGWFPAAHKFSSDFFEAADKKFWSQICGAQSLPLPPSPHFFDVNIFLFLTTFKTPEQSHCLR